MGTAQRRGFGTRPLTNLFLGRKEQFTKGKMASGLRLLDLLTANTVGTGTGNHSPCARYPGALSGEPAPATVFRRKGSTAFCCCDEGAKDNSDQSCEWAPRADCDKIGGKVYHGDWKCTKGVVAHVHSIMMAPVDQVSSIFKAAHGMLTGGGGAAETADKTAGDGNDSDT